MVIAAMDGPVSEGIPPVQLPLGMSRALDGALHRAADAVGSEADTVPGRSTARRELFVPKLTFDPIQAGHIRIR